MKEHFLTMAFSTKQSDQSKEFSEINLVFALSSEQCDFRHEDKPMVPKLKIDPK